MTRCKFRLDRVERSLGSMPSGEKDQRGYDIYKSCEMRTITMSPVYGNGNPDHENTKFWSASPSGNFTLAVVNLSAVEHMELGKEYYVDITEAV